MSRKRNHWIARGLVAAIAMTALLTALFSPLAAIAQADAGIIYWVFDVSTADSQFGYWDGTNSTPVGDIFDGRDFEGLACIGSTIYASGGGDGAFVSTLVRVAIDQGNSTSTLTELGNIETADGQGFFEVSSLGIRSSDNTLWGYAAKLPDDGGPSGGIGIIKIDAGSGKAELIQSADLDVAGMAWLGDTLYLGDGNDVYTWTEGGTINVDPVFSIDEVGEIEALDSTAGGNLYIGGDGSPVMEFTPAGALVNDRVFIVQDGEGNQGDPEALTRCLALAPTALAESTEPAPPLDAFQHFFYFPFVVDQ